ncbi:MAG: hypothetical protein AB8B55_10975 [Mariniblastus sp.]
MLKFDFKKSNRKCFESERQFQPGEEFYSALFECDDGSTERRDFSSDVWNGPTEDTIGFWKSRVPELGKGRIYWAPKKVLLAYFEHVLSNESSADVAFVTGLLLAQKKILSLEDDGGDDSRLVLLNRNDKTTFEVPVVDIEPKRLVEIQNELSDRLFMDQPIDPDVDEADD